MSEPERITVICVPVVEGRAAPIANSAAMSCVGCGMLVWVAPSSQRLLTLDAVVCCLRCGVLRVTAEQRQTGERVQVIRAPGADQELEDAFRDDK